MANGNGHNIYEFDHFRLDAAKLMLYHAESEISLPPKVIKTLAVLVEHAGEILSKDDLMERVWEGSIVEEANLSQYLYLLRKTLGQNGDSRPYIETLRRRGYRFNGDVRLINRDGSENRKASRVAATAGIVGIERQGNVLRLVERAPEAQQKAEAAPARGLADPAARSGERKFRNIALAALALASASVLIVFFVLWRPADASTERKGEMSVTRLTNGGMPLGATISRDGKYIAYTETENETSQLWLQAVGQSSRIKVTESSDKIIGGKTFSPDGRFIYYGAWDKENFSTAAVYRISTIGEPSTKVLDNTAGAVSFSPDGEQMTYFKLLPANGYALMTSDKNGGSQKTILTRQSPEYLSGSPSWSPDGQRIVFAASAGGRGSNVGEIRIYTVEIATGRISDYSRDNWDAVWRIVWTPDGKGVVMTGTKENDSYSTRRDQVYYVTFSDGIAHRITTSGVRHDPASLGMTDDGAVLALSASRSSQVWSMDAAGQSTSALQLSRGLYDGRPGLAALSDGKVGFITYTSDDFAIWTMNPDGTDQRQLTSGTMFVEELRSDPVGRYFVFSAYQDKQQHLFRIDTDGQNLKQITTGNGREIDSAVSPDGAWVIYASFTEADKGQVAKLYRSSIDGGETELVGDNECSRPSFSPDGNYLSCVTEDDRTIYILSPETGQKIKSFEVPRYSSINFGVRWLPDSSAFVYIRSDKNASNLWAQPLDGSDPRPITDFTSGIIYNFVYSFDGTRLFLARGYPIQDAFLIRNFR